MFPCGFGNQQCSPLGILTHRCRGRFLQPVETPAQDVHNGPVVRQALGDQCANAYEESDMQTNVSKLPTTSTARNNSDQAADVE